MGYLNTHPIIHTHTAGAGHREITLRMRVLLAVAALVAVAGAASLSQEEQEFHSWKQEFGKSYSSDEEESQRKMIWMNNRKLILEHNKLADQGLKSYRLGMNQFGDMDSEEYQMMFSSCLGSFNITEEDAETDAELLKEEHGRLPRSVDWRKKGYVTDVKNQRQCGSCWAFSATGALEGQWFKKKKVLISLSEQQLVDCSRRFGNHGCRGGWPHSAFQYIKSSRGIEADLSYPYKAQDGRCRFNRQRVKATCRGFRRVPRGREKALQGAVAKVGPIAIAIDTSKHTFQLYKSGVYDEPGCSSNRLTHAVVLTGYGQEGRKKYWMVKNSWGVQWGDNGYIKMSRDKRNQCGIASVATYPIV